MTVADSHSSLIPPLSIGQPFQDLVIQPKKGWIAVDWSEMYRYRELLYFLVWRDVKVRYKQTVLGFAWALLQPLMQSLVAVLIFGAAAGFQKKVPTTPYLLFALVGQIPWQFFANALGSGGMSLVNQQHLLTKIYFPRLFLPTGVVGGLLVDLLVSTVMLICFMVYYYFSPTWHFVPPITILYVPLLMIPMIVASMGVAYFLSAVTVTYRDFRFLIPIASQLWMWMSWVMMPRKLLLDSPTLLKYEWLFALNPMYGIIEAVRHFALGGPDFPWNPMHLVIGSSIATVMCVVGMFYFRKTERRFADIA